jgi:shikimate dehydrogenase
VLIAVAGWPVAHSRSPEMHNAALRALGLAGWLYVRLPIPPELFAETVRALPGAGYRGLNVTIPHKEAALAVADTATQAAREIGAANTLTFAEGGIEADNTDAQGFLDALGDSAARRSALILGAGGAARAVAWALRKAGAGEVMVWNRTPERARQLADELGVKSVDRAVRADILVNATSVGLGGTEADLPLTSVGEPDVVVDLVYGDVPPPVTAWALARGMRIVDGGEILVCQGARSFSRWTGQDAPTDTMRAAIRTAGTPLPLRVPFAKA